MRDLLQIIQESAVKYADKPMFFTDEEKEISYSEIWQLSCGLAHDLHSRIGEGNAVAILGSGDVPTAIAVLASILSGNYFVPLNINHPQERIISHISACNARILLYNELRTNSLAKNLMQSVLNLKLLAFDSFKEQKQNPPIKERNLEALAYVVNTSGSTGIPKSIPIKDTNLVSFLENRRDYRNLSPGSRVSWMYDLFFDPSIGDIFYSIAHGLTLCPPSVEERFQLDDYLERTKVIALSTVPSLIRLSQAMNSFSITHNCLQSITFIGERLTHDLASACKKAAPNAMIINEYGPAECTISVTSHQWNEQDKDYSSVPIGKTYSKHKYVLIDERFIENDHKGELCIHGPQVFSGYTNQETKSFFVARDGLLYYRTGDIVERGVDETLLYLGREDRQIKIAGQRFDLFELDSMIKELLNTEHFFSYFAHERTKYSAQGINLIVWENITDAEIEKCIAALRTKIPLSFLPKRAFLLQNIPISSSGKFDGKEAIKAINSGKFTKEYTI